MLPKLIFIHSYSSNSPNWDDVMIGTKVCMGRLLRGLTLAEEFRIPAVANDQNDPKNQEIFDKFEVLNLMTAERTIDEVRSALQFSGGDPVLFVTSPDHLPRVVRDVLSTGGLNSIFASSDIPFSSGGVDEVEIREPTHCKLNPPGSKAERSGSNE